MHRRVAVALEEVYAGPQADAKSALLAYHFREASEHDKAARFSVRAGDRATRLCSYGEARAHFAAAMEAIEHLPVSADTRRQKVDVLLKQIYTTLVAEAAEQNFKRAAAARALLDEAIEASGATREDQARIARLNYFHGRIHFYRGETKQALEYYRKVLPAGIESGDEELIALPSCLIGAAVLIDGNAIEAEPLLAQAIAPLERLGEPFEWFRAVGYHGLSLIALGRYGDGVAELDRVRARAREVGQPSLLSAAFLMSGSTFLFSGDWPLVIENLERTLEYAEQTGDKLHLSLAWSGLGWAYSHLGRHELAEDCRAKAQHIADALGGRLMLNDWYRAGDAEIALLAGQRETALERARAIAGVEVSGGQLFSRGVAERVWGEIAALSGDRAAADEHMARSLRLHEAGGIHVQTARTRFRWALQCRARGEHAQALDLAGAARDRLAAYGCAYALAECERLWQESPAEEVSP
jgi:tetratricopeptide (TPR) repeat protein